MNDRKTLLRTLPLALTLAAAAAFAAVPARADWRGEPAYPSYPSYSDTWADGQLVDVQVRVAGRAAPLYLSPQGDSRRYFQALAGRNYSIVLRNNTGERVGVLVAVDGLNVVSGDRSKLQTGEAMYVLGPWETATIDGWRTSLDDIQRFVFVDEQRSYASRTGQANGDMGWVRVLAFREQRPFWQPRGMRFFDGPERGRDQQAPRAAAPAPQDQPLAGAPELNSVPQKSGAQAFDGRRGAGEADAFPGTGWGQHQNDHVEQVRFDPERRATDQLILRYEYASGLRALGIFPDRDRLRDRDRGELGFAKPPMW